MGKTHHFGFQPRFRHRVARMVLRHKGGSCLSWLHAPWGQRPRPVHTALLVPSTLSGGLRVLCWAAQWASEGVNEHCFARRHRRQRSASQTLLWVPTSQRLFPLISEGQAWLLSQEGIFLLLLFFRIAHSGYRIGSALSNACAEPRSRKAGPGN